MQCSKCWSASVFFPTPASWQCDLGVAAAEKHDVRRWREATTGFIIPRPYCRQRVHCSALRFFSAALCVADATDVKERRRAMVLTFIYSRWWRSVRLSVAVRRVYFLVVRRFSLGSMFENLFIFLVPWRLSSHVHSSVPISRRRSLFPQRWVDSRFFVLIVT